LRWRLEISLLMQINICARYQTKLCKVAWTSLQPDGSISFGLTEKTFVSPQFMGRIDVFSLYNQVVTEFLIESNPSRLVGVLNPHFTFHPRIQFHLTDSGGRQRKHNRREIFRGINDVEHTVDLYGKLPWIRAITAPIAKQKSFGLRQNSLETQNLEIMCKGTEESISIGLDFVRPDAVEGLLRQGVFAMNWHAVAFCFSISSVKAQLSTLSWFHSY
jgi:hypothetical protein